MSFSGKAWYAVYALFYCFAMFVLLGVVVLLFYFGGWQIMLDFYMAMIISACLFTAALFTRGYFCYLEPDFKLVDRYETAKAAFLKKVYGGH